MCISLLITFYEVFIFLEYFVNKNSILVLPSASAVVGHGHGYNEQTQSQLALNSAIAQLRPLINSTILTKDFMQTDYYLSRWLKVCDLDAKCAADKLFHSSEWRVSQNFLNVEEEDLSSHRKNLPYNLDGFDRFGNPVFELFFGKWDLRKYILSGRKEILWRLCFQLLDKMEKKVFEASNWNQENEHQLQMYGLIDIGGYALRKHACYECIQLLSKIAVESNVNYPLLFRYVTYVNVPRIAEPILTLLKGLLGDDIAQNLSINGPDINNWRPLILKEVDPNQISTEFGGNKLY